MLHKISSTFNKSLTKETLTIRLINIADVNKIIHQLSSSYID
jgi:hypothetical protein